MSVLEELREAVGRLALRLVPYEKEFNFSEKCNVGVLASHGDVVVLLNDDIEVASARFIPNLVAPLFEDGVGLTGRPAALLRQHDPACRGCHLRWRTRPHVLQARRRLVRPVQRAGRQPGVLGADRCMHRCEAKPFRRGRGNVRAFPLSYNDVDFCFKIASAGYRQVLISTATAFHFESKSRDPKVKPWERRLLRERWLSPPRDLYVPSYGTPRGGKPAKPGQSPMTVSLGNGVPVPGQDDTAPAFRRERDRRIWAGG